MMKTINQFLKIISIVFLIFNAAQAGIQDQKSCDQLKSKTLKLNAEISDQQLQLKNSQKQLASNKQAIDRFNKNCRMSSVSECQPAMYSLLMNQMPLIQGQQIEIGNKLTKLTNNLNELKNNKECQNKMK